MALDGSVSRCVVSPIRTVAFAYWPARSTSSGLSSSTTTRMPRVPGSAAGAMRSTRPATPSGRPSTLTETGMPVLSDDTWCVPTTPASSSSRRSTTVSSSCSALTFSPGNTLRLPTMPAIGAASAASRTPSREVASWA